MDSISLVQPCKLQQLKTGIQWMPEQYSDNTFDVENSTYAIVKFFIKNLFFKLTKYVSQGWSKLRLLCYRDYTLKDKIHLGFLTPYFHSSRFFLVYSQHQPSEGKTHVCNSGMDLKQSDPCHCGTFFLWWEFLQYYLQTMLN